MKIYSEGHFGWEDVWNREAPNDKKWFWLLLGYQPAAVKPNAREKTKETNDLDLDEREILRMIDRETRNLRKNIMKEKQQADELFYHCCREKVEDSEFQWEDLDPESSESPHHTSLAVLAYEYSLGGDLVPDLKY